MRRIVLHATSFNSFWAHYSLLEDIYFADTLRKNGFELVMSNKTEITDDDYVLFLEAKSLNYLPYLLRNMGFWDGMKFLLKYFLKELSSSNSLNAKIYSQLNSVNQLDRALLLVLEGKVDAPENHSRHLGKYCKYIFSWNDELVDGTRFIKINWPQPVTWPAIKSVPFSEKKLLTNISGNKYSTDRMELYSIRRKSIQYFERRLGGDFDLFGIGWNEPATMSQRFFRATVPIYKSYVGQVISKPETFSKYRFALIYENTQVPGYITEKLFDCLRSECVPIYLGAPNIEEIIPNDIYVDRRNFKSDEHLVNYLISVDEDKYNRYLERIAVFMESSEFKNHLSTHLAEKIIATIGREN